MTRKLFKMCVLLIVILTMVIPLLGCDAENVISDFIDYTNQLNTKEIDKLRIHAKENGYEEFVDYMQESMSESDYNAIMNELKGEEIKQGIKIISGDVISADYDYCYIDGIYTIPYGVNKIVKWSINIKLDSNNNVGMCRRHYEVIDYTQDAYMLLSDSKNGYQLIRILATDSLDIDKAEIDYTKDGVYVLLENFESKVKMLLLKVAENAAISQETLEQLYEYEQTFGIIYMYAQNLTGTDYEEIMTLFESDGINTGIDTIVIGNDSEDYYYSYKNGVFIVDKDYYQTSRWDKNITQDTTVEEYAYTISNLKEEAYLLLFGKDKGHMLVHFTVSEN